jgi:N-acylneuraminate cytidylyltransferase
MLAVIPARGGSQRIPRKNIKKFHGKPIMAYSIELAHECYMTPVVTTDDKEIASIARNYGAKVFWRGPGLELDHDEGGVGTQAVAQEVFAELGKDDWFGCVIYPTAPLLTPMNIYQCTALLHAYRDQSYVYSVDDMLRDTGGFYFGYTQHFIDEVPLEGNSIRVVTGDIDINTPEDWDEAERIYRERYL